MVSLTAANIHSRQANSRSASQIWIPSYGLHF